VRVVRVVQHVQEQLFAMLYNKSASHSGNVNTMTPVTTTDAVSAKMCLPTRIEALTIAALFIIFFYFFLGGTQEKKMNIYTQTPPHYECLDAPRSRIRALLGMKPHLHDLEACFARCLAEVVVDYDGGLFGKYTEVSECIWQNSGYEYSPRALRAWRQRQI
jgi:hypothetical protein